eukprot:g14320.t1
MTSILEQTRSAQEAIEQMERTMARILQDRAAFPESARVQVACEHGMAFLISETQKHATDARELYEDKDNLRAEECDFIAGIDVKKPENTVWNSFYEKIKEVKTYHRKNPVLGGLPERRDAQWYYNRAKERDRTETSFSSEEAFGRRLDLHALYNQFINLKRYRDVREKRHIQETKARLLRQNPDVDFGSEEVAAKLQFEEIDYVKWLQTFHEFWEIPRFCKYRDQAYMKGPVGKWPTAGLAIAYSDYLTTFASYLEAFARKALPLQNITEILHKFEEDFEAQYEAGKCRGWEDLTCRMDLYTKATDRLFANENTKKSHENSKAFQKKLSQLSSLDPAKVALLERESVLEDMRVAKLEQKIQQLLDVVADAMRETVNIAQLKQSMTAEEYEEHMELEQEQFERDAEKLRKAVLLTDENGNIVHNASAVLGALEGKKKRKSGGGGNIDKEDEDIMGFPDSDSEGEGDGEKSDDDERAIYNPLKLPVGWDGKPIPFWLYKLHDMGREYKCEICGNHSYWGPRAFHQHFSEWRHANGLRALKIPNTKHFAEITKIADAVALWEKLNKEAGDSTFNQEHMECEDAAGNVMTKRAFDDLRRQGLV